MNKTLCGKSIKVILPHAVSNESCFKSSLFDVPVEVGKGVMVRVATATRWKAAGAPAQSHWWGARPSANKRQRSITTTGCDRVQSVITSRYHGDSERALSLSHHEGRKGFFFTGRYWKALKMLWNQPKRVMYRFLYNEEHSFEFYVLNQWSNLKQYIAFLSSAHVSRTSFFVLTIFLVKERKECCAQSNDWL